MSNPLDALAVAAASSVPMNVPPNAGSSSPPQNIAHVHEIFKKNAPMSSDDMFTDTESIVMVPGVGAMYEGFVQKVPKEWLEKTNVVAIFADHMENGLFEELELHGVGVVLETVPLLMFKSISITPGHPSITCPKIISTFTTKHFFAFNSHGISCLASVIPSLSGISAVSVPSIQNSVQFLPQNIIQSILPTPSGNIVESSHRARQNAVDVQNLKVLFRRGGARYRDFVGAMENLGSEHVLAMVQRRVPASLHNLIALSPVNLKMTLKFMFQLAVPECVDVSKAVPVLHISLFKYPGTSVTTFGQLKKCYERFRQVLCSIVDHEDIDQFMHKIFQQSEKQFNSIDDRSLSKMDVKVVETELSKRLVDFSMTLASPLALTEDGDILAIKLQQKLFIDEAAVLESNMWALLPKMNSFTKGKPAADPYHQQKKQKVELPAATSAGVSGKPKGYVSKKYCIEHACVVYLDGSKVYGGKKLGCIHGNHCYFSHDIPKAPVTLAQKDEFVHLASFLEPDRQKALLALTKKGTFST